MPQYNGVWTLEAQAQAQSNQQWVTDPNFKNTTLLLQADGTGSGSQNQTFLDGSTNNFFITRNGNTTQGSFSPFSQAPGFWSNYFNGSSYLQTPSSTNYAFGTGDFTIEAFFFPTATTANLRLFEFSDNNDNVGANTTSTGTITYFNGSTNTVSTGLPFTANQWNHVAVVRSSGTVTVYVNGTSALTQASTPNTTSARSVGIAGISNTYFPGYVSNVRILKGTAAYTATFTPPTAPLTAITNTQLLTCQSNRFVDNSVNGVSFTIGSAPQVQAFGPFAPALQWTPDVVGGSGYFDGTSDYLSLASNANLTPASSTYTFECWVYRTASGAMTIWDTSVTNGFYIHINGSNKIVLRSYGTADIITSSLDAPVNAWFNLVVARGAANSTKMWINGSSTSGGSATDSTTYVAATTYIGIYDGSTVPLTGYIAGMRLVKGSDVYGVSNSTITIPTAPPTAITNTQFLANFTNAGIYDGKMGNVLETVGNAQVSTNPVKYGSGSMYFDGSGDYLIGRSTDLLSFGTGDFTIEMWINPSSIPASDRVIMDTRSSGSDSGYTPYINGGTLKIYSSAADRITSTSTIAANVWSHIAFVRASGTLAIYINGVQSGTAAYTGSMTCPGRITIAAGFDNAANYSGFIDDLRVTKGVARYFTNFTPPQQALPRQ